MSQYPILIVLAGGASSRLWPLSDKSLLQIAADPETGQLHTLIGRHLAAFARLGYTEAVVIANPENAALLRKALSGASLGVEVVVQPQPIGMGDAILRAENYLKARDYPPIYVTQAHDVVDDSVHKVMLQKHREGGADSFLAGYQVTEYFPGGYLTVEGDGRITGLVEKPGAGNEPSDLVSFVAHLHRSPRALLEEIHALYASGHAADDHYEFAMSKQMARLRYEVVRYSGPWLAVKFPWHVLEVMNFYLESIEGQHISPDAFVADSALIRGNVVIAPGARIFHGASVMGPAYIGEGAIVGNGALVRESLVGPRCVVGHVSEVARSYLAAGCQLHRAVVLDSVFDENVNFSAGCITANLRWDKGFVKTTVKGERINTGRDKFGAVVGRDAFIGIQSGTMPGVKVGQRAVVGPFTNATRDIPDDTLFYTEQSTVEKPIKK
ncbi:MAG: NTP transferase domain-containing protein [Anaerolineae bacterium]|nr:NTP transferase domain-containing protein [Anaerolineae bacterium]